MLTDFSVHALILKNNVENVFATVLLLFCQYFSHGRVTLQMNELVISTYIQIMQDGLVEHNKQEIAGRFLLDSIAMQEAACVMTNLDAKK